MCWWFGQPVERLVLRIDFLATLWLARIQEQSLLQAAVAFPSGGRPCACLVAKGCLFIVRVLLPGFRCGVGGPGGVPGVWGGG